MDFSRKLLRKAVAVISAVRGFQKAGASRALRSPPQSPESSPEMSPDYDGTIIEVDDANFKKVVLDGRRDVLIEFYTDWVCRRYRLETNEIVRGSNCNRTRATATETDPQRADFNSRKVQS